MNSYGISKVDVGIITNMPSTDVVWCAGRNVAFKPGSVYKTFGKTLLTTIANNAIRAVFTFKAYDNVWRTIVCCDTKIYSYTNNFTVQLDITPASPPTSTSLDTWRFALIGGIPIISNGVDPLWKWDNFAGVATTISGAPSICKALCVVNNRVVVGNIQESGYSFPARIRWTDLIGISKWDKNLKLDSGQKDLVSPNTSLDGIDQIQAITHMNDTLVIFCERNIWYGAHADHPIIYSFSPLGQNIGLIANKVFVKTPFGIFFMGQEDFYVLSGTNPESIGFNIRNSCFPNLNKNFINTSFAYYKPSTKEVVFCVPTGSNETPDTAFVYQLETKAWSIWDVDYLCHTQYFDSSGTAWDSLPFGSWDSITDSRWDTVGSTGILPSEAVGDSLGNILKLDSGYNNNGNAINSTIETGDIFLRDKSGDTLDNINKIVYEILPVFKPQSTVNDVMIQIGVRQTLHQDITWSIPMPFTIGVSTLSTLRQMGKCIRLRFYTDTLNSSWILNSWKLTYDIGGSR